MTALQNHLTPALRCVARENIHDSLALQDHSGCEGGPPTSRQGVELGRLLRE